jgi:hypothetical protein
MEPLRSFHGPCMIFVQLLGGISAHRSGREHRRVACETFPPDHYRLAQHRHEHDQAIRPRKEDHIRLDSIGPSAHLFQVVDAEAG